MTKASEAIKAVFQFIPEVMQFQEVIENLLIKYSTEACEEQKQICVNEIKEFSEILDEDEYAIINSPLPDFI